MTINTKTQTIGRDGKPDPESTTQLTVVKRDSISFVSADNEPIQARAEVVILPEGTYVRVSDVVTLTERTIYLLQKQVGDSTNLWRQCSLVPQQHGVWPAYMPIEQAIAAVKDLAIGPTVPLALQFLRAIKRTADAAAEGKFTGIWASTLPDTKWKPYEKLLRKKQEEETPEPEPEPEEPQPQEALYAQLGHAIEAWRDAKKKVHDICTQLGIIPPWTN